MIVVLLTTVTSVAAVVPKSTAVAPVNPVPVIVTAVPPAAGPLFGLMPVTVGAAAAAWVSTTSSPSPPTYEMVNGVLPIVNEAPSGSPSKVPTIGTVLLMIVNCSPRWA